MSEIKNTPEQPIDVPTMHEDHRNWQSEQSMWQQDLQSWTKQIDVTITDIETILGALRKQKERLADHAREIGEQEDNLKTHEHELASCEKLGMGYLEALTLKHFDMNKQIEVSRKQHETIKQDQHRMVARVLEFEKIDAGIGLIDLTEHRPEKKTGVGDDGQRLSTPKKLWTVPNAIGLGRALGSFALIGIALLGFRYCFVGVYFLLGISDLVDGIIARRWKQRSDLGAWIDSVADGLLNFSLLIGVTILCPELLRQEVFWIAVVVLSYLVSSTFGLWKFGRLPIYHAYSAKVTHGLVLIAAILLVLISLVWPLRIAALAAILANLEAIAITYLLKEQLADVPSVFLVRANRRTSQHE